MSGLDIIDHHTKMLKDWKKFGNLAINSKINEHIIITKFENSKKKSFKDSGFLKKEDWKAGIKYWANHKYQVSIENIRTGTIKSEVWFRTKSQALKFIKQYMKTH